MVRVCLRGEVQPKEGKSISALFFFRLNDLFQEVIFDFPPTEQSLMDMQGVYPLLIKISPKGQANFFF